jgi:membrane protein DedA with SNARE-associated domain
MESFVINFIESYLSIGVFILLFLCGFGVPIPEDIILITGGYIAYLYQPNVNIYTLILVSYAGVMLGDSTIFILGKYLGPSVVTFPGFRRIFTASRVATLTQYFINHGAKILFAARFMPGVRSTIFLVAGMTGTSFFKFFFFDGLAAIISVPTLVFLAYYFGEHIDQLKVYIIRMKEAAAIVIIAAIIIWIIIRRWERKKEDYYIRKEEEEYVEDEKG